MLFQIFTKKSKQNVRFNYTENLYTYLCKLILLAILVFDKMFRFSRSFRVLMALIIYIC